MSAAPSGETGTTTERDLLYDAWGLIANAYGGNWSEASAEWVAAAERWRNQWHLLMAASL